MEQTFNGRVTIRVRFRSRPDYEKFRKYILKTEWSYDLDYPMWEELKLDFHSTDDMDKITSYIISLLQTGFEVYCCKFQLEEHLAEEEHPTEEDPEDDSVEPDDFDLNAIINNAWKKARGITAE